MSRKSGQDLFEAAYTAGVSGRLPRVAEAGRPAAGGRQRAIAAEDTFALRGSVLTPDELMNDGYVVVAGRTIQSVGRKRPTGTPVLNTQGVILPGMIDLHGHPEFNIFAAWEPPRQFPNRYAWRGSDLYRTLVREPQNKLLTALEPSTQLRYAEVRALVGGVTAIQGASGRIRRKDEPLVRNVDLQIFGTQRARAMIDLPTRPGEKERLVGILEGIENDEVAAFYVHLAEGRRDNERSHDEFDTLVDLDMLTKATVVIHGSALTRDQFSDMASVGAKLVWSPQSNLRLYGETTDVAAALDAGVLIGLGADWLPSGSPTLLHEMKVARRVLVEQGAKLEERNLVRMVTSDAARVAGLDDMLGRLKPGRPADLVVLERHRTDPWENVVEADPSWVELVCIDGDLCYGRSDWVRSLVAPDVAAGLEQVLAWGRPMLLDTTYRAVQAEPAEPSAPVEPGEIPPTLAALRDQLITHYPQVGPIFA